jgi:hypothetical protein
MAPSKTAGPKPAQRSEPKPEQKPEPSPLDDLMVDESEAPIDIPDERDVVKRQPKQAFSGKIVKAKPTHGGVVVEMRPEDWANVGIPGHPLVRWDFLINKFMVPIEALSEEALAYLLEHDANRFEVIEVKNATE